ncbi:Transcriptional enhancer factor TEF-1 [Chelonia mydas]|uniref:Transcriptional enhancer factor TEF-1 n=1 Tax=Chelonia mydas TaxID=8469 RepID=M7BG10_CHEMY|nr:Transcriptional enhancer factor TEF-1 [Chelonia mydas]
MPLRAACLAAMLPRCLAGAYSHAPACCTYLTGFAVPSVLRIHVIVMLKDQTAKDKALQHMAAMSSAQIVSATAIHNKLGLPGIPRPTFPGAPGYNKHLFVHIGHANHSYSDPLLESVDIRQIYDKFPEKKGGLKELFGKGPQNAFFLVKFWTEYARFENGRFVYRINRSPMCEYMINFIHKLKHLPEKYMMNSVLENFTILLVVTNRDTQETLLCMACVFEVSNSEHGAQHHIYRLVKD